MEYTLSVHPLVILVALTAGTVLAGIIGAILSVPLTAVAWAGIKAWNAERDEDITNHQIIQAETYTLIDEQGHGPSNIPDAPDTTNTADSADDRQDPGQYKKEQDEVRTHSFELENRSPVSSQKEALQEVDPNLRPTTIKATIIVPGQMTPRSRNIPERRKPPGNGRINSGHARGFWSTVSPGFPDRGMADWL